MKQLILLSMLSTLFFSCRKEQTIHISAKNPVTGLPYSGLKYVVVEEKVGINGNLTKERASGVLDANGEAYVTLRFNKNNPYVIEVKQPENICYTKQLTYHYSLGDAQTDFPFEFAECAYLKFRYKNTNCQNLSDHIEVTRKTNLDGYFGFNNPAIYNGCTDFIMPEYVQVPMGWWFFDWEVTKNGITENFSDTIFISPNEFKYYEFNY